MLYIDKGGETMHKKIIQLTAVAVLTVTAFLVGRTTQPTENKETVPNGYIKLEECIPLEDISSCFINEYDYPCFELKDVGNQLDNPNNRSYIDIMESIRKEQTK